MKAIDNKALWNEVKHGRADKTEMRKAIASMESDDLDEREPMDCVADAIERLSKVVMAATEEQASRISALISAVTSVIDKISDRKIEVKSEPVEVNIADSRPTEWTGEIKDSSGNVKKFKFSANRTVH